MFLIEDNLAKTKKMLLFIKCPALAFGRKSTVSDLQDGLQRKICHLNTGILRYTSLSMATDPTVRASHGRCSATQSHIK